LVFSDPIREEPGSNLPPLRPIDIITEMIEGA